VKPALVIFCFSMESTTTVGEKRPRPAEQTSHVPSFKRMRPSLGNVCVAKYYPGKPPPAMPGYRTILIHTRGDNLGGDLSPYVLRNEKGHLLENIWQFSKVYPRVAQQRTPLGRFQPQTIVWEHKSEEHCRDDGTITPEYWAWRQKGLANPYAVRYPNGFHGRSECLFSLWPRDDDPTQFDRLDYIAARKKIYCGEYVRLAPKTPHFRELKSLLAAGESLLLAEVDGPDPTLTFPPYDQITEAAPGLKIDEAVIKLLINDTRKPFGHGYVIAALLLGGEEWLKCSKLG
jgi:hypothetical protein